MCTAGLLQTKSQHPLLVVKFWCHSFNASDKLNTALSTFYISIVTSMIQSVTEVIFISLFTK